MGERDDFKSGKEAITFVDLFAGAGGICIGINNRCAGRTYCPQSEFNNKFRKIS